MESILISGLTSKNDKITASKEDITEVEREKIAELVEVLEQLYIFTNIIYGETFFK